MPRHFRITVDGRSYNVAVEDLDQGTGPADAPAAKPAAAIAPVAPATATAASPAGAPLLARIKVSLHPEGSLAAVSGGSRGAPPSQARRRTFGLPAKLIMLAGGFGVVALLVAGVYWKRGGEGQAVPATAQSDLAAPERTEASAGQGAPAATGEIGPSSATAPESRPAPPAGSPPTTLPATDQAVPARSAPARADASLPSVPSDSPATPGVAPRDSIPPAAPPAPHPAGPAAGVAAESVSPPAPATAHGPSDAAGQPEMASSAAQVTVQLATVYSAAKATYEWDRLQTLLPDMLAHRELVVGRTEHGGRRVWLVLTRGFEDNTQAAAFCRRLHAKGFHCVVITAE